MNLALIAAVLLAAFGASFLLTPVAARLGARFGFVDQPRKGEVQARTVARTGGYAIFLAFCVGGVLSLVFPRAQEEYPWLVGFLIGAAIILPLAVLDDIKRLGPTPQFVGQALVALIPISFGITVNHVASPLGGIIPLPQWTVLPLTFFWYLGMMNTLNFVDTMDGLAAGISAIAAAILSFWALQNGQYSIALLTIAMMGACLGFLPHNFYPAKVIMGTSGSLFLGYALATLGILGAAKIATTLMVLSIPIIDTGLVIVRRLAEGRSPFKGGDSAHLPHRLLNLGLSQTRVALLLYALSVALGLLALSLSAMQKLYIFIAMAFVIAVVAVAITYRARRTLVQEESKGLSRREGAP